ncbi:MAG TPA: hypothetical protein VIA06_19895 [Candidatus Dormibacteraeota bacterium]|jgi:hypothetical protein|nr:hypothetical protein [Candidatus Dormibacteraeota bacterium]
MCKTCGCDGPHDADHLDYLSRLAAEGREDEHARMHRLGIAHGHHHEHDHGDAHEQSPAVIKVVRASRPD